MKKNEKEDRVGGGLKNDDFDVDDDDDDDKDT